jgi:hypothetical protein
MRRDLVATALLVAAVLLPLPRSAAQSDDSIRVSIRVPASVRAGRPVPIRLSVTNRLNRRVALRVASIRPPVWDVRVTAADGAVVWNRLHDSRTGFANGVLTLGPHETRTRTILWDQRGNGGRRVSRGRYHVRGFLYARLPRGRFTATVPLRIR